MAEEEDDKDLRARLDSLSTALDAQQKASQDQKAVTGQTEEAGTLHRPGHEPRLSRPDPNSSRRVVVGGLIGWKLDDWCHTTPLFLIVFLGAGTAAGFWNVYRIAAKPTGSPGGLM